MADERETRRVDIKPLVMQLQNVVGEQKSTQKHLQLSLETIAGIKSDISHINTFVKDAKLAIDNLKSSNAVLQNSTQNINALENAVAGIQARMVDGIRDRVAKLEAHYNMTSALPETIRKIEDRVMKLEGYSSNADVENLSAKLAHLENIVNQHNELGSSLESRVQEIETVARVEKEQGTKNVELWKWVVGAIISLIALSPGWWAALFNQEANKAIEHKKEKEDGKSKSKGD